MEKRFVIPTLAAIFLTIVVLILGFLPLLLNVDAVDLIPIIPGGVLTDVIISTMIPFIFMIAMIFLGPYLAILFVKMHNLIKLKKYDYFIITLEKKLPGKRILIRTIFPGLLAVNIAIYITLYGDFNYLFHYQGADPRLVPVVIEYASIIVGIPIAAIVVLPIWMLQSSGLMCFRKTDLYNRPITPDIEGVGHFYTNLLKGYVGISTIISYSLILYQYLTTTRNTAILVVFVDPIVIIFLFMPISLILEILANKLNKRLYKKYQKIGIDPEPKQIKIE
ncbi:MAG: hypothetical protein GF353_19140 [Candidatus Lokiarchaeota archaeon]|nr:hypothetical protein [Candidatus Lokiarchaeota archaeon]